MNGTENSQLLDQEKIKERILDRVVELWGIPEKTSVDPMIKLLADVLGFELAGLGREMKEANSSILERLSELLLPRPWLIPKPFHALAKAHPLEPVSHLDQYHQFYVPVKQFDKNGAEENADVFFSPLRKTQLVDGKISLFITRKGIYQDEGTRMLLAKGKATGSIRDYSIWLGISIPKLESLKSLCLHFQFPEKFKHLGFLLENSRWFLENGKQLHSNLEIKSESQTFNGRLFSGEDKFESILTEIADFYANEFLQLKGSTPDNPIEFQKSLLPESLLNEFEPGWEEFIPTPLVWIRGEFPEAVPPEAIQEIRVRMNVFPVISRKLHSGQTKVGSSSKVTPLVIGEKFRFFAMARVVDRKGREMVAQSIGKQKNSAGTWFVHQGSLERFDQRDASTLIAGLMRVVREEGSELAALGQELTLTNLNNLNNELGAFKRRLEKTINVSEKGKYFLVLFPFEDSENIEFEYWGVMGDEVNLVGIGAALQQYKDLSIAPGSAALLTKPLGGTDPPSNDQKVRALRYGLLTREQLVSRQDICHFIQFFLPGIVDDVRVREGVAISSDPQKGLIRTTIIEITPTPGQTSQNLLDASLPGLKIQLERKSVHTADYVLKLVEPDKRNT